MRQWYWIVFRCIPLQFANLLDCECLAWHCSQAASSTCIELFVPFPVTNSQSRSSIILRALSGTISLMSVRIYDRKATR
ncbi:hypothetical protein EV401DRAFT_411729 [Pisolithus croceorrhizus]|nr:hypothetical protein EV401DRAFT_411729 [Pisolithus croceorrhizus]